MDIRGSIRTKVAGVTYTNEDGTKRQDLLRNMNIGESVELRDEASAEHPEAVGVYDWRERRLGYLPKDMALHIRQCGVDDVEMLKATVDFVGSEYGKPLGMVIVVEGAYIDADSYGIRRVPYQYTGNMSSEEKEAYENSRRIAKERWRQELEERAAEQRKAEEAAQRKKEQEVLAAAKLARAEARKEKMLDAFLFILKLIPWGIGIAFVIGFIKVYEFISNIFE